MKDQIEAITKFFQEETQKRGVPLSGIHSYDVSYFSLYHNLYCFYGCKESASCYPYKDFIIKLNNKAHYVRFKALCRLLGMPINQKIIASFTFEEETMMVLGGWFIENSLNKEIARFLAKATVHQGFETIDDFIRNHYLIDSNGEWQSNFRRLFANLKGNLELNTIVNCQGSFGIIACCHHDVFKFVA